MTEYMQFQIGLFSVAVVVCVAWTRMVYYDGVMRQIRRLRRHCMMHAAMISGVSFWAMSIGFNLHHASMATITEQAETIQHLATDLQHNSGGGHNAGTAFAMAFESGAGKEPDEPPVRTYEVAISAGTRLSWSNEGDSAVRSVSGTEERIGGGNHRSSAIHPDDSDAGGSLGELRGRAFRNGNRH